MSGLQFEYLSLAQAQAMPLDRLLEMYNEAVETIRYLELRLSEERQQSDDWEYAYQQVADMLYG